MDRRVTRYLRAENAGLWEWARRHTGRASVAEAALRALQTTVARRQREALAGAYGIWAEDRQVEAAFKELEAGWSAWSRGLGDSWSTRRRWRLTCGGRSASMGWWAALRLSP